MFYPLRDVDGEGVPMPPVSELSDIPKDADGIAVVLPFGAGDPRLEIAKTHPWHEHGWLRFDVDEASTVASVEKSGDVILLHAAVKLDALAKGLDERRGPFIVGAQALAATIAKATKGVSKEARWPLCHVGLRVVDGTLTAVSTDCRSANTATAPVEQRLPLQATVPPWGLRHWLESFAPDEEVVAFLGFPLLPDDDAELCLSTLDGRSQLYLVGTNGEEFPWPDALPEADLTFSIPCAELKTALTLLNPTLDKDDQRALWGLVVTIDGGRVTLESCDTHGAGKYVCDDAVVLHGNSARYTISGDLCRDTLKALAGKQDGLATVSIADVSQAQTETCSGYTATMTTVVLPSGKLSGRCQYSGVLPGLSKIHEPTGGVKVWVERHLREALALSVKGAVKSWRWEKKIAPVGLRLNEGRLVVRRPETEVNDGFCEVLDPTFVDNPADTREAFFDGERLVAALTRIAKAFPADNAVLTLSAHAVLQVAVGERFEYALCQRDGIRKLSAEERKEVGNAQ